MFRKKYDYYEHRNNKGRIYRNDQQKGRSLEEFISGKWVAVVESAAAMLPVTWVTEKYAFAAIRHRK